MITKWDRSQSKNTKYICPIMFSVIEGSCYCNDLCVNVHFSHHCGFSHWITEPETFTVWSVNEWRRAGRDFVVLWLVKNVLFSSVFFYTFVINSGLQKWLSVCGSRCKRLWRSSSSIITESLVGQTRIWPLQQFASAWLWKETQSCSSIFLLICQIFQCTPTSHSLSDVWASKFNRFTLQSKFRSVPNLA